LKTVKIKIIVLIIITHFFEVFKVLGFIFNLSASVFRLQSV